MPYEGGIQGNPTAYSSSSSSMASMGLFTSVLGAGMQAWGAYQTGRMTRAAIAHQAEVYENNRLLATWAAADAQRRGITLENMVERKRIGVLGAQRASAGKRGVSGPGQQAVERDTDLLAAMDKFQVRSNAETEALGAWRQSLQHGANASILRARANAEDPGMSAATSILGNFGTVAERWYKYSEATREDDPSSSPLIRQR